MKTLSLLVALAFLAGCTTTTTRTRTMSSTETVSATAQTPEQRRVINKRVYTQEDLQKTGHPTLGGALQTVDPSVYISGR